MQYQRNLYTGEKYLGYNSVADIKDPSLFV